jgi:hypothetical protein
LGGHTKIIAILGAMVTVTSVINEWVDKKLQCGKRKSIEEQCKKEGSRLSYTNPARSTTLDFILVNLVNVIPKRVGQPKTP